MLPETFTLHSTIDQLPLRAYVWHSQSPAQGVLLIAHGMGEHARRYQEFADFVTSAGFAVYALDHRGHGASPGPEGLGDLGAGGWNALVADLALLADHAKTQHPALPVVLLGHSMGSFAAQQFLLDYHDRIDAAILSGSAALDHLLRAVTAAAKAGLKGFNAQFEPARTAYDWLSRDEQQVDLYIADPLCGFDLLPGSAMEMAIASGRLADGEELKKIPREMPILLLAGSKDSVTGNLEFLEILRDRYQEAGLRNIASLFYPEGRHEMLNEINRREVFRDLLAWLQKPKP